MLGPQGGPGDGLSLLGGAGPAPTHVSVWLPLLSSPLPHGITLFPFSSLNAFMVAPGVLADPSTQLTLAASPLDHGYEFPFFTCLVTSGGLLDIWVYSWLDTVGFCHLPWKGSGWFWGALEFLAGLSDTLLGGSVSRSSV